MRSLLVLATLALLAPTGAAFAVEPVVENCRRFGGPVLHDHCNRWGAVAAGHEQEAIATANSQGHVYVHDEGTALSFWRETNGVPGLQTQPMLDGTPADTYVASTDDARAVADGAVARVVALLP